MTSDQNVVASEQNIASAKTLQRNESIKPVPMRRERPQTSVPIPKHLRRKARVVSVTKDNAFSLASELYGDKKSFANRDLIRVESNVTTPKAVSSLASRHQR